MTRAVILIDMPKKMRSPFPGTDPCLERHWRDVHAALITYSRDALLAKLPDDLLARIEERVYVESRGEVVRTIMPDVKIVEDSAAFGGSGAGAAVAVPIAIDEPIVLQLEPEHVNEPYIVITDADGNRIITVVEFLSPSNKVEGEGRTSYMKKYRELLAGEVNIVEIDLVRTGEWVSLPKRYQVPVKYRTTYRVCVRRNTRPDKVEMYPITLRQKLPAVHIPLRPGEKDVSLDLQPVLDQAYRNGRYDRIDYTKPCDPPLAGEEAAWATELPLRIR